ncbi:hypothetical protein [Arthrobacter sp. H35-D1]|uniref:hypothetical protein n=1 Tax=Arthrobacter sp. H35-D1 TaxID=3046202 RepID=UPI0024B8C58A|nr:hypothetical protein [Arthrobacter sp. H35-D1]MDJ0313564.1 hypothetical protein [Arthrobacter sp. H35-D1]
MKTTPRQSVTAAAAGPRLVQGADERFTGYGVMGVPYASGHYLVLRDMLASSLGTACRSIWHRDPTGRWTTFTTADPAVSCPRYFGSVAEVEQVPSIVVSWRDDWRVHATMGTRLSWRLALKATSATRAMTTMGAVMPQRAWNSDAVLGSMGPMAGGVLRSGRVRLHGRTPNGQGFKAAPLQVWRVIDGDAELDGTSLGALGPLAEQSRLGDFWLPQRGLFFVGQARFTASAATAPVNG